MSFILPWESNTFTPSFSIHSDPSLAGDASLAIPVFSALAPSEPVMPALTKIPVMVARSDTDQPTELTTGPASLIASNKSLVVVFADACAFARTSA